MKLKSDHVKLVFMFVLLAIFIGVVFVGSGGEFSLENLGDRASRFIKMRPVSEERETREDASRDRGRGRGGAEEDAGAPVGEGLEDGWWCTSNEAEKDSESSGGGSETGGESDSSSSGFKFIDPAKLTKLKIDPDIIKILQNVVIIDTVAHEDPPKAYEQPDNDDWIPELKPEYEDSQTELDEPLRCFCLDKIHDIKWVDEDVFYGDFGGDEDAYCEMLFPPEYCENPVTIDCSCTMDGETTTDSYTISEYGFENYYDGDEALFCDSMHPPLWCDPVWDCAEGEPDWDTIDDVCDDAWKELKKAAVSGICGEEGTPNVTPEVIDVCKAANGPMWGTFDYLDNYMCIDYDDCLEYASWMAGGYYTDMIKATFGEDAGDGYIHSCYELYGYPL